MRRLAGFLFIAASAAAYGAMPVFARVVYSSGADPTTLLFLRFGFAAPLMLLLCAARRSPLPRGRPLAGLAALGGIGYVAQAFCYFTALTLASASLVALVLYLYPVLVAGLAVLFLKERLTLPKVAALGLAVGGAVLTIGFAGRGSTAGVLLAAAAALVYSVYILAGARIMKTVAALPASAVVVTSTAIVYAVIALARGPRGPTGAAGWLSLAALSLVCTVGAIALFFAGMQRIGPTDAATVSTLEPVVAVFLAAVFLGERIGPFAAAGGAAILAAVLVLARSEIRVSRQKAAGRAAASRSGSSG
jgi:drug/metabolite transporter (DMT)-like permease